MTQADLTGRRIKRTRRKMKMIQQQKGQTMKSGVRGGPASHLGRNRKTGTGDV
jgi:hypothetical protein